MLILESWFHRWRQGYIKGPGHGQSCSQPPALPVALERRGLECEIVTPRRPPPLRTLGTEPIDPSESFTSFNNVEFSLLDLCEVLGAHGNLCLVKNTA